MRHMRSRRILAMLLALSMIFGLLTTTAFADNEVDQNPSNVGESAANGTSAGDSGEGQPSGASEDESSTETNKEDVLPEEETIPEEKKTTSDEEVDTQEGEVKTPVEETTYVASIGEQGYASLDAAIQAATEDATITLAENASVYLTSGIAHEGNKSRTVTIQGDGTQTIDIATYAVEAEGATHLNYQRGSKLTFNNVKIVSGENTYDGIVCSELAYNDCTITGVTTLYGAASFMGCTFENTMENQYSIWTWGGTDVEINGCTFNTNGKAILLYGRATEENPTNLTVSGTTFNDRTNGAAGKAAIEIGNDYNATYTLNVTNSTVASGFAEGKNTNSKLWANKNSMAAENLTVEKDGELLYGKKETTGVAKVGNETFDTLEEAFTALNSTNYTLELLDENAWTGENVYWAAGTQSGYEATLAAALTAAYKANAGDIKIICRPGADVGTMTHGHVADNLTIYGNKAYISGGECDLEVDTYKFSRTTGAQAADGEDLGKDITITAYELDNLGVWGQRNTGYTVNVNLTDCDTVQGITVQRVYISGTTGVNNITLSGCDFGTKATSVYSNADGDINITNCSFTGAQVPVNFNHKTGGNQTVTVSNSTFTTCGSDGDWKQFAAPVRFVNSGSGSQTASVNACTFADTVGSNGDILIGDGRANKTSNDVNLTVTNTAATVMAQKPGYYKDDGTTDIALKGEKELTANDSLTNASIDSLISSETATKGTEANPYTLKELGEMTRGAYIDAQNALGGTMYVSVGDYSYGTDGVLGNGERDDTPGQNPDHSKLNAYGENGYLGEKNDGANGKSIVFVNGSITSGVTGYETIDGITKITSLLLAVPAYTNVTFKGITFNNVMCFNYQLYTSPWSQLGELKFEKCTFNGIIIGSIAAQTLTFNGCTFENFKNTTKANNSNPTWIRPAYGNWTEGDNEGQGQNFKSLTTINFTNNTVASTRPVKFEYISQWNNTTTLTATGNSFDISAQEGDTETKNVGLYIGPHTDKNAVNLVLDNNTKTGDTAALYVIPRGMSKLPVGSTVKDSSDNEITITDDALEWKTDTKVTLKTEPVPAVKNVAKVGDTEYATLEDAIANAEAGQTVTLIADVIQNSQLSIDKSLTLNLACHKIYNTKDIWSDNANSILSIKNGAAVTITGNGTIDAKENDCYTINVVNGELTIENGTFYGNVSVVQVEQGKLTVNGGSFALRQKWPGKHYLFNCIDEAYKENTANVEIYGGTFDDFDPNVAPEAAVDGVTPSFAAPGVGITKNADGTFTAKTGMVAQVLDASGNSVKAYASLADAIAAAEAGQTVRLLADATEDVTINKNITLDLGGKTLTNAGAGKATITIAKDATATVKNGSVVGGKSYYNIQNNGTATFEGLTATAGNTGSSMIDNVGTLTITSGTYTGGLNVVKSEEGSKLTINGGKFTLEYATSGYTGVIFAYGDTTITGGEFIQSLTTTGRWNHPQVIATGVVEGYTAITRVTGGTFTNKLSGEGIFRGVGKGTSDNFEVSGGTFNKSISESFCADGFIPTKNADGTYGVKEGKYVAKIGSTGYETLTAAIAKATGKTKPVTLVADVTESIEIAESKTCKIDLNGFTLTNTEGSHTIVNNGTLTIKDSSAAKSGTVDNVTNARAAIVNYGTMTLAGGTYTRSKEDPDNNKDSGGQNSFYTILNDKGGSLTIEDGVTVTNVGHFSSMIRNGGDAEAQKESILIIKGGNFSGGINTVKNDEFGKLTISGGSFSNTTQCVVMNWNEASITGGTFELASGVNSTLLFSVAWSDHAIGKMTISGGTFKYTETQGLVQDTYNNGEFTGTLAVSGGTFAHAVEPKYCAEGFEPVTTPNYDGFYEVKAVEGDAELLNADGSRVKYGYANQLATDTDAQGKTIKLFKDTTNGGFMLPAGVTLDLNGKTMTSSFLFATGNVIDSADGTGKLVVAKELVQFQKNDTYLPLYNKAENAYQFFKYSFLTYSANLVPNTNNDKLQIVMQLIFENKAAYDILVQDPDGIHGIKLGFSLSWGDLVSISQTWEIRMPSEQIPPIYKGQANPAKRGIALTIIGLNQLPTSVTTFNTEAVLAAGCWPNSISVSGGLKTTTLN